MRNARPAAQLVIAGGASLLDHSAAKRSFDAALAAAGLAPGPGAAVMAIGELGDDAMPSLYRLADALVFPSLREGFGLVVLEAMASGTPVIVSRTPPFTEYLAATDCLWVDPTSVDAIAAAMDEVCDAARRQQLIAAGHRVAARHRWAASAARHDEVYAERIEATREAAPA